MEVENIKTVKENVVVNQGIVNQDVQVGYGTVTQQRELGMRSIDEEEEDDELYEPDPYIAFIDTLQETGPDQLFNSCKVDIGVLKLTADTLLISENQLEQENIETIKQLIQNEDPSITTQTVTMEDDQGNQSNFTWYGISPEDPLLQTRDGVLSTIGGFILVQLNQLICIQVGGRYKLNQKGYWIIKRENKLYYVFNDYTGDNAPILSLVPGDCYFYIGADVLLSQFGIGKLTFSCCVDTDGNFCFNTPFGEFKGSPWELATKCFVYISTKLWRFFSRRVGPTIPEDDDDVQMDPVDDMRSIKKETENDIPHYPGLIFIENI